MMLKAPFDLDTVKPTCPVCRHTVPYLTAMHCCPECEDADLIYQQAEAIESERRANELSQCPMCGKRSDQDNDLCADCRPYLWEPTQADWDDLMSRPILPSPIVEQDYAPVFHWSNPDGN